MGLIADIVSDNDLGVRHFLEDEGGHPVEAVTFSHGWDFPTDQYRMHVHCRACGRDWGVGTPGNDLRMLYGDQPKLLAEVIVPFLKRVARSFCFKFSLAAELAEWVTTELAEAGPDGIKYATLVTRAVKHHLCTPYDVDTMLRKLGFLHEAIPVRPLLEGQLEGEFSYAVIRGPDGDRIVDNPTLTLPDGHPLKEER